MSYIAIIILIVIGAKCVFDRVKLPRWCVWFVPLSFYGLADWLSAECDPFLRMVLLCSTLMMGMKWVVYAEWRRRGGEVLSWGAWLCFCYLWFGMDPGAWTVARRKLSWRRDFYWGMGCLSSGVLSVVLMAHLGVGMLLPLFVGMSVAFHYGVLRLLVAFWRWCGRPVRVLFRNPLKMQGFADFWGKRWNLAYSQMMAIAVMRPLLDSFGKRPAQFGVFVISGLLHELAITVPVGAGYGWPTLFFVLQGMFTVSEVRASRVMAALCGLSLVVGLPMLFPEAFVEAVIYPARDFLKLS